MGLLITILAGAFIGWIASKIMKTDASMGALANIVAGIVGSAIGSMLTGRGFDVNASFHPMSLLFGIIGACILIGLVKLVAGGTRRAV
jgi:uncharacterized membrane protein YeaQ/YmgE (transglycosylase-associated protein family)